MNLHFLWTFFVIRIFVTLHVPALNFSWALTFLILFPSACAKLLYSSFAACPTFNFLHALLCCREALCLASRERLSVQIPSLTMWQVPSAHLNLLLSSHELFLKITLVRYTFLIYSSFQGNYYWLSNSLNNQNFVLKSKVWTGLLFTFSVLLWTLNSCEDYNPSGHIHHPFFSVSRSSSGLTTHWPFSIWIRHNYWQFLGTSWIAFTHCIRVFALSDDVCGAENPYEDQGPGIGVVCFLVVCWKPHLLPSAWDTEHFTADGILVSLLKCSELAGSLWIASPLSRKVKVSPVAFSLAYLFHLHLLLSDFCGTYFLRNSISLSSKTDLKKGALILVF